MVLNKDMTKDYFPGRDYISYAYGTFNGCTDTGWASADVLKLKEENKKLRKENKRLRQNKK